MSGGSYNYLCHKDEESILEAEEDLQQMADRLAGLGYADDAAKETEDLLLTLRKYRNRINTRLERLSWVWRSVEWWDSGDTDEEGVKKALATYRGEK